MDAEPQVKESFMQQKFGEVTNQKLFKVRGDPHWSSTPTIALELHNRMKQFIQNGGFTQRKAKK